MRCAKKAPRGGAGNSCLIGAFAALVFFLAIQSGTCAERVVSLNLCTDQMLVLLAPEKIAALTPLVHDPALSFVAPLARRLPTVRASAEALLRLKPDLVLAAPYGAQTVVAVLQQQHVPMLRVALPHDFAGIRQMTRSMAARLDVPEKGEALIAAMDASLQQLPRPDHPVRALVWEPRGLTEGPGSLMDAVLRSAGLSNVSTGRPVSLEALLTDPPDLLIVPTMPDYPSLATALLDHPALAGISRRELPPPLTICAGPFTAQAVALLAQ